MIKSHLPHGTSPGFNYFSLPCKSYLLMKSLLRLLFRSKESSSTGGFKNLYYFSEFFDPGPSGPTAISIPFFIGSLRLNNSNGNFFGGSTTIHFLPGKSLFTN